MVSVVMWCSRPESNRYDLAIDGFSYLPQLSLPLRVQRLGSGLSLHHNLSVLGATRLVSTPSELLRLGSGLASAHMLGCKRSPNLGSSTLNVSVKALKPYKSVASTNSATRAYRVRLIVGRLCIAKQKLRRMGAAILLHWAAAFWKASVGGR